MSNSAYAPKIRMLLGIKSRSHNQLAITVDELEAEREAIADLLK